MGMSRREGEAPVVWIVIRIELDPVSAADVLAERGLDFQRHSSCAQIMIIGDAPQFVPAHFDLCGNVHVQPSLSRGDQITIKVHVGQIVSDRKLPVGKQHPLAPLTPPAL